MSRPKDKKDLAWYRTMFDPITSIQKKRYTFGDLELFRSWGLPVDVPRADDSETHAGARTSSGVGHRVVYKGRSDRVERAERKNQKKQKTSVNEPAK